MHVCCCCRINTSVVFILRDLVAYVEWDVFSSFGDHSNLHDCQLLLVEQFPSGIYIDPDKIKNEVEFGGPEVRFIH